MAPGLSLPKWTKEDEISAVLKLAFGAGGGVEYKGEMGKWTSG